MKFYMEKLTLKNWGPFHEKTSIDFSTEESNKQVTYITGLNAAGKTMIFNALYWCLFDSPEPNELGSIVNKDALENGEKQMSVRLKFHVLDDYDNMTDYDVTRLLKFDVGSTIGGEVIPTMIQRDFNANKYPQSSSRPQLISQKDFGSLMDNLIPPGPRQFFFLDGEKLAELFKIEHFQMIESYANAISDINLIDMVINKLDETYNTFNDKYAKSSRVGEEIETEQRKLDRIKEKKDGTESWEREITEKLNQHRKFEAVLREECADYEELKPRLDRIKEFESEKGEMKARYDEKFSDLKKFLNNNLHLLYLEEQLEWCSNELMQLKNKEKIPPKIPSDIIDDTLSTSMCMVCKREITEEIKVMLSDMRSQIPDKKLSEDVQNFWREVDIKKRNLKDIKSNLENRLIDIKKINLRMNELKNKIGEEKKYVPHVLDDFNIHAKFEKLNEVTETIADLQNQLERARNAMMKLSVELTNQQKNLESKLKKNSKMKEIGAKLIFVRETKETMEKVKKHVKQSMIEHVQRYTSDGFKQLVWDPENWRNVIIADDWEVSVTTSNNHKLPCYNLSAGQRHVLGIAFMSSLGKVTGNLVPFVFDSPFGRISEEPIENIGKNLRSLMGDRQVVFFVTDTEDKNIRPHIEEIIGQKYILDKISATESVVRGV